MITKLGGRKAAMAGLILATGIGLVAMRGDVPPNMLTLLMTLFSGFVVGNIGSKVVGLRAIKPIDNSTPKMDSPIESKLDALSAQVQLLSDSYATSQQGIGFLVSYVNSQVQSQTIQAQRNRSVIE